jgi:hypothetical protein
VQILEKFAKRIRRQALKFYFWHKFITMKKILIPIMVIAIILALYEQSKAEPNIYITVAGIVVFMFGMMRLSAKVPSKNSEKEEDDV